MKNLITSILIIISCVVTAQNVKVTKQNTIISSVPYYTVGSRNGIILKTNRFDIKKNKHVGYKNVCIGYPAGKQVKNKKIVKRKKSVIVEESHTQKLDTIPCLLIITDTSEYDYKFRGYGVFEKILDVSYVKGFEVVERHSTAENSIDPGIASCVDSKGNPIPCYYDYFKHLKYLDSNKKPFKKEIVIIQKIENN